MAYKECPTCGTSDSNWSVYRCERGHLFCTSCSVDAGGFLGVGTHSSCPRCGTQIDEVVGEIDPDISDDDNAATFVAGYAAGRSSSTGSSSTFRFPEDVISGARSHGYRVTNEGPKYVAYDASAEGATRTVYAYRYGEYLEFTVRSRFRYRRESDFPRALLLQALRRSAKLSVSYWCVEKIGDEFVLEVMSNRWLNRMDRDWIGKAAKWLIKACVELENDAGI